MFRFSKDAEERLNTLQDLVTIAQSAYTDALKFYGEDTKSIASTEQFFGTFKTFVDSYKVSRRSFARRTLLAHLSALAERSRYQQGRCRCCCSCGPSRCECFSSPCASTLTHPSFTGSQS